MSKQKFTGTHEKPLSHADHTTGEGCMDVVGPAGDRITIVEDDFDWYKEQGYEEAPEIPKKVLTFYEMNSLESDE
jgi:hypothetical protein